MCAGARSASDISARAGHSSRVVARGSWRLARGIPAALARDMDIVTWLVVGLVAGVLAGLIVGGYGVLIDMVIGMVGALVGGWLFTREGWHTPMAGLPGTIFVAFIGALILLVILRLLRSASVGGRRL